jgi:hypothetical protein
MSATTSMTRKAVPTIWSTSGPQTPPLIEGQGHRRVDVRSADAAGHVDAEDHGHGPAPGDQEPVAGAEEEDGGPLGTPRPGQCRHRHRHHAASEGDEDERPEELRQALARQTCATSEP